MKRLILLIISFVIIFISPFWGSAQDAGSNNPADTELIEGKAPAGNEEKPDEPAKENGSDKTSSGISLGYGLSIGAYVQVQYLYEQVENSRRQTISQDSAQDKASGFNIVRARLSIKGEHPFYNNALALGGLFVMRFETGTPGLLDGYGYASLFGGIAKVCLGQMKIPSTYEVEEDESSLDFVSRSYLSTVIADYSLSRNVSSESQLYYINTYMRDTGIALKGDVYGFSYFFMLGNGLGANLFVGGEENSQFVYANEFGDYFYGLRGSIDIIKSLQSFRIINTSFPLRNVSLGGHYNSNHHDNLLYRDKKTVFDIDRVSWSGDAMIRVSFPFPVFCGISLVAMIGGGIIESAVADDDDYSGNNYYKYKGWETRVIIEILRDMLEAAFRYDTYTYDYTMVGGSETQYAYTAGVTFMFAGHVKAQANYKWKYTNEALNKDLDDDIFVLQVQMQL